MSREAVPDVVTVTFLCTDIVGSTALWQESGALMRERLAWHDATVRQLAAQYGGDVFKDRGDGFLMAFPTAIAARNTAIALQQAVFGAFGETFQIRTVLGTGEAERRNGDYFGLALNRATRVLELSHGLQLVLTEASARLLEEADPKSAAALLALGSHQLRGIERQERLFQLPVPGLPDAFPPLTGGELPPHNLPRTLTTFVGRERECTELARVLLETRLLTLLGAGGSGKTRLSLKLGDDLLLRYPSGVWFVDLAPVVDAALLPRAVGGALRVREGAGAELTEAVLTYLASRCALLILDNCEHLIEAAARFTEQVLRHCPEVTVLATSREALDLFGEVVWSVPGLSVPPEGQAPSARLMRYEAVALFVERATAASSRFRLTGANGACVARICRRLDGIPLALELAAAWMSVLAPEQIEKRLDALFGFLTRGSRTALPRQQTLRGAMDWSHDLLTPEEQLLWRRVSVFASGFTLEAVEAVCSDDQLPESAVLDALFGLVRKSILLRDSASEERYRILETIREYGLEKLEKAQERGAFQQRHLAYFTTLAEEAEPHLRGGAQKEWLDRLEAEHPNIRTALAAAADPLLSLRLATATYWFCLVRGLLEEGYQAIVRPLSLCAPTPTPERARGYRALGILAMQLHRWDDAESQLNEAVSLFQALDAPGELAITQANFGILLSYQNKYEESITQFERSLAYFRQKNDNQRICGLLTNLSVVFIKKGSLDAAIQILSESLDRSKKLADTSLTLSILINLGVTHKKNGNTTTALKYSITALTLASNQNYSSMIPRILWLTTELLLQSSTDSEMIIPLLGQIQAQLSQQREPLDTSDALRYAELCESLEAKNTRYSELFNLGAITTIQDITSNVVQLVGEENETK